MVKVYLQVFKKNKNCCLVPVDTLITIFVINYCDSNIKLKLVYCDQHVGGKTFTIDLKNCQDFEFVNSNEVSLLSQSCELPNIEENDRSCIAGLCATLRYIIRNKLISDPEHKCRYLLGFKESCLQACSESSSWTRFCEIDMILSVRNFDHQTSVLPNVLARFEYHMSQPIRLHNVYKNTSLKKCSNASNDNHVLPERIFVESETATLADIMIFVCIHCMFFYICIDDVIEIVPLTLKWYNTLLKDEKIMHCLSIFNVQEIFTTRKSYILPEVNSTSLYKNEKHRNKSKNKSFTKQCDVDDSLNMVKNLDTDVKFQLDDSFLCKENLDKNLLVDWYEIPVEATPKGGNLPDTRLKRKFHQLENLSLPIIKLAKKGNTIVDFCSGGGHLGILLAYLLPRCQIILLENKAESMKKAKERVSKLRLKNVKFYQCNLDYFKGDFEIGTSLHACGVATDLVIQTCIEKKASFVCSPCCYGSVKDCHKITYPRSNNFKLLINKKSYMVIGHAADQTHDFENVKTQQGYDCMLIVDTDRKMLAEEHGYKVYLNKMKPETCSPKNHLLIGVLENTA